MKKTTAKMGNKTIAVYINDKLDVPVVFSSDYADNAESVVVEGQNMNCPGFHFVSITGIKWDEELSPWQHEPVVTKNDHFTGEADRYLKELETKIIPYVKTLIPSNKLSILAGYSMGGLFALYAAHKSQCFDAYVTPSSSVWYPNFVEYVERNYFCRVPKSIYLSIGDMESQSPNEYLSQTERKMKKLNVIYRQRRILSTLELNPGNHYQDASLRMAKGIFWTLKNLTK